MDLGCVEYQPDLVLGRTKESKQAKKQRKINTISPLHLYVVHDVHVQKPPQSGPGSASPITIHALLTHWMSVLRIAKTEYKRWAQGTR